MGLKTDKNWTCNLECSVREIFQHKKFVEHIHTLFPNTQQYVRLMLQMCIIDLHLNFQNVEV